MIKIKHFYTMIIGSLWALSILFYVVVIRPELVVQVDTLYITDTITTSSLKFLCFEEMTGEMTACHDLVVADWYESHNKKYYAEVE